MFKGTTIEELMNLVERTEVHASTEPRTMPRREPAYQMPVLMFDLARKSQGFVGVA